MLLDRHLVVHLQGMYASEREYREYLLHWTDRLRDQQLKSVVNKQAQGIEQELLNLNQALLNLGAFPQDRLHSPAVQALRQDDQMMMQTVPGMSPADFDIHVAMTDIAFGAMEIGKYQGMLAMAKALNQPDVAQLLQQNLDHEEGDLQQMQALLPALLNESQQQQRAA